jgi:hypothetical protein
VGPDLFDLTAHRAAGGGGFDQVGALVVRGGNATYDRRVPGAEWSVSWWPRRGEHSNSDVLRKLVRCVGVDDRSAASWGNREPPVVEPNSVEARKLHATIERVSLLCTSQVVGPEGSDAAGKESPRRCPGSSSGW